MKYESFTEFLGSLDAKNEQFNNKWEDLKYEKRKKALITAIIILIIDIIILNSVGAFSMFLMVLLFNANVFIFVISHLLIKHKDITQFNNDYKERIINELLKNFIEDVDYVPLKGLPKSIYDEAKYGGFYNKYYSDDYFEGKMNGKKIVMANLLVQKEEEIRDKDGNYETETTTVFNGIFGKINLEKTINCNLTIANDYRTSSFDKQKIDMDSFEFEKEFNVYTDNQITAMQLLTADIQSDILELYNEQKIRFHISITNNTMYVLFNTGRMFEVFSSRKNPNEVLEKFFEIMRFIYMLVDKIINTIDDTII